MTSPAIAKPDIDNDYPHLTSGRSVLALAGVMWSSLQTLIPTISAAIVFFVSAMFLSPADFGLVGLASGLVMTVIAFTPVAFGEALIQRKELSRAHADSVFWLTVGFGALCFLPLLIWSASIANLMGDAAIAAILPVLALRIPLDLAAAVPNGMIARSMKFKLIALRTAVATLVSLIVCLAMLFAGYGYWALVGSQISGSLVACAMAFWVAKWRPGFSLRWQALRDLAHYGVFASGNRMLATVKLDHLVLGILAGPAILGLFFFAQRFYFMLTQLVGGALSSVTLALLSTLQDDAPKTAKAFGMASYLSAAVSMPMFCALAITAPTLLDLLLDDEWAGAAFAVQAFCIAGVLAGIGVVQAALIKAQNKAHWWFWYQLVQQATSVLVIALTANLGLQVLMVALMAKSVMLWPVSVMMTAKLLKCSPWSYLVGFATPLLATTAMALAMLAAPILLPGQPPILQLTLQLAAGAAIYAPLILLLSRDRITDLRRHFAKKVPA
ncbi:lipopolysaccharide biosynthesis protein [Cognatiyoonia sp. IB215182]|uniref:lipopolysaccharide biosynthesis protein n=1 Tax=Cognatiyoonia sp. IB215182 TaxID=3097353 RepID=UPI002A15F81C|nr:lipopolysaccharide biosynthesis protein [Cognatiyoonia sp. IB215182]MDX8355001.1 lipopolysaccharide biosynthesis protein [Cognatiyoonia sp. IB215182]